MNFCVGKRLDLRETPDLSEFKIDGQLNVVWVEKPAAVELADRNAIRYQTAARFV